MAGRPAHQDRCSGTPPRPLAKHRPPWRCTGCGDDRLHHPLHGCACSFVRKGNWILCRACAIAYDYVTKGSTKITSPPITLIEWQEVEEVRKRGEVAKTRMG